MPMLDVSFVTTDPMLSDLFDVERRAETVDDWGRAQTGSEKFPKQRGVVIPQDPADLSRRDDGQLVPRTIEINAPFKFREASQGFQPDLITWRGSKYLVSRVYPFSHYGKGHTRCLAESVTATDPVQQ